MNYIETNKLDFLSSYWKNVNVIAENIVNELPKVNNDLIKSSKHISFIQYKDLNNWSIDGLFGNSPTLLALANKISTMIHKGDAINVKPMINGIVYRGLKKQSHPPSKYSKKTYDKTADFLGYGHFRWNYKAYILTEKEIEIIKNYFKL